MPERGAAVEDKRALIRGAAVRVFARKGYHACRVSDIAEEAGVAYGLVYHYFAHLHTAKAIGSAVLAILLWPLILLGINLHIH